MLKKVLVGAVAVALTASAAHAGENKLTKEEGAGLLTGAAAGAIVGGPVGAAVGLIIGGIIGDSVGTVKRADERAKVLEDELMETRLALSKASEKAGDDQMLNELAARLHADVMFRTGSAELDQDVTTKLTDLGKLLAAYKNVEVRLHGFADPRGKSEENLKLSASRAEAVREALIGGGADPAQVAISAHGEDLTTAAKDDMEAYAWERRVSLSIHPSDTASVAQSRE